MLGSAPWVIEALYAYSFHPATNVLRWMVLGDVLKVASWPLGYIILAAGDGRTFMWTEALTMGVFVALTWLGLSWLGVVATGVAFVGMYVVYLPLMYWLARRKTGFVWSSAVVRLMAIILALCVAVAVTSSLSRWGAVVAAIFTFSLSLYALGRLVHMSNLNGLLRKMTALAQRITTKLGIKYD